MADASKNWEELHSHWCSIPQAHNFKNGMNSAAKDPKNVDGRSVFQEFEGRETYTY